MSSDSALLSLPDNPVIVGFGGVGVDLLATVESFPKPDTKNRTTQFKVSKEGTTPFSYIIIDNHTKTRTCIFTEGYPTMVPEDLSRAKLLSALNGARVAYFDVRMPATALVIAREAFRQNISILVDAERPREGLNDLLDLADYAVCSEKFPQTWTEASSIPRALVSILLRLPRLKFVIATLGKDGCIMLQKCADEGSHLEEVDVDNSMKSLTMRKDDSTTMPTCVASNVTKFRADGIGSVCGRLYFGTSEKIPPSELIDTTGAGDAFVGAVLYAICANFSPEKMLPFASHVAAAQCRAIGARSGLPYRTDPYLASFIN
ncbi:pfkB family carbohydrate kinase [Medicago truncatula]|uniref:PfkB family carbohydrate kinase n=1 Tax=Medicago truncatula TaxID=3880 RepID=A0A072VKB0_MEDTR|nr:pfkB family carbohydrate kinase [Medicago truncatula]